MYMRRLPIVLCLLLTIATVHPESDSGALLRLEDTVLDLGAIEHDSTAEDSIKIYNDGLKPLVITSIFTDCSCTVPSYSRDPIEPGDSGVISIRFNSRGRGPGDFRKAVRIRSNASAHAKILFVKGRIKRSYLKN